MPPRDHQWVHGSQEYDLEWTCAICGWDANDLPAPKRCGDDAQSKVANGGGAE